ncbi:hypothetical protein Pcinc_007064 [Petrolisthes cinctipes]|uniref:Uncharacterized protein n=1 Tax=Petrolisthes cinctipes TaxID=88211 RepID=A0AAE1GBQ1_PETCI|nr:hypothetical protein Pcinc_007064 [Petrolisthes cinctipes]
MEATVSSASALSSYQVDEEPCQDGLWSSVCERQSYSSSDVSSLASPEHAIQTVRSRKDGGENEIEKLILAAETLALERAKMKLHGSLANGLNMSSQPQQLLRGAQGGERTSFSAATTVSAREAGNIHQRIKNKEQCEKTIITNNSSEEGLSMCSGINNDVLHIVKYTSDQSVIVGNCDGPGQNSQSAGKSTDSQESSFCDSAVSKACTSTGSSSVECRGQLNSKETSDPGEAISSVPRLSLELTDESGYSSNPLNERPAMGMSSDERQVDVLPDITSSGYLSHSFNERLEMEGPTNERLGLVDERPVVSKDEKDECNSSIRGSATGGQERSVGPKREGEERCHLQTSRLINLEQGEVSTAIKEGCGSLLTLALTSTSNLRRVTRLLHQVVEGGWMEADTRPIIGGGLQGEVAEYETLHTSLELQLSSTTSQLQVALSAVQEIEAMQRAQEEEAERFGKAASQLLQQVESTLLTAGLQRHLAVALTSPRRRMGIWAVESAGDGMTLVEGELERRGQCIASLDHQLKHNSQEMQDLRETLMKAEVRLRAADIELKEVKGQTKSDVNSLKQCLAHAEESLRDAQLDRMKTHEVAKKQLTENSALITDLKKRMYEAQHKAEARTSELEHLLLDSEKARLCAETSLVEVRDQLTLRTQQMHLVNDENCSLIEGLREALKQQKDEVEQVRQQLETNSADKISLSHTIHDLKMELSKTEERRDQLHEEISKAWEASQNQQQDHTQIQKELQDKIDNLTMTRCELESQIRSLELTVLQLRTEHRMEQQRARMLADDNAELQKKANDLQTRLWKVSRRRRDSSRDSMGGSVGWSIGERDGVLKGCSEVESHYSSSASLLPRTSSPLPLNTTYQKDTQDEGKSVDEGRLGREEQLHTLLREKDTELQSLHNSFSQQLSTKNQELESLTEKLECLEGELAWVVSGLEASAALGDVTAEVGRQLQARTHHLQDLDQDSRVLHQHFSDLATENQNLSAAAVTARKEGEEEAEDARNDARKAREEARKERLATAHIQERCQKLQAQLDSAMTTLEQERREKRLNAVVQGVKNREFSTLLDSATAVLNLSTDPSFTSDA